jgi:hypothetical protein
MLELTIGAGVVILVVVVMWALAVVRTRKEVPAKTEAAQGAATTADQMASQPLALPKGSVRAILGLLIVGEFLNFLIFGWKAIGDTTTFSAVLAAFATLSGAVTGFYFGSRGASEKDKGTPSS